MGGCSPRPVLLHVYQGLYGDGWWSRTEALLNDFAQAGAQHVTGSTGRLDKRRAPGAAESLLDRMLELVGSRVLRRIRRADAF